MMGAMSTVLRLRPRLLWAVFLVLFCNKIGFFNLSDVPRIIYVIPIEVILVTYRGLRDIGKMGGDDPT
jgi:hypothetical protein